MSNSSVSSRLSGAPHGRVMELIGSRWLTQDRVQLFPAMNSVNLVHVVMLERQGCLKRDTAIALIEAIESIRAAGPEGLEVLPEREDLYFNYEHAVIQRTGEAIGGMLHLGRSRNDLGATMSRIVWRQEWIAVLDKLIELRSALLDAAERHVETVMPGYTHLQPAQPTTLGHYFMGISAAIERDFTRMNHVLDTINRCPLGAAAFAGTSHNIDPHLTARLLGFDEPLPNTLDSVANNDYVMEAMSSGAILGTTLSRFAHDLLLWCTYEYGLVSFGDSLSFSSSIMPQKKNPVILEVIKAATAHVAGGFASVVSGVRNTSFSNTIDTNREAFALAPAALEELSRAIELSGAAVSHLVVNEEIMIARCEENFSTVTQLADLLVTEWGISFREAHHVVGDVVRVALERELGVANIDAGLVCDRATERLGRRFTLDETTVERALSARNSVLSRDHFGATAPRRVHAALATARDVLDRDRRRILSRIERIEAGVHETALGVAAVLG